MKKALSFYSRQYCLLFLLVISFSCNKKSKKEINTYSLNDQKKIELQLDSITISVNFKLKGITGFNIKDKYHQYYCLEFNNTFDGDTTIIKKIVRPHKNQLIDIAGIQMKNGTSVFFENYFLIDSTQHKISFNFFDDSVKLISEESKIDIDSIHAVYNKMGLKIKNSTLNENLRKNLYAELENSYLASSKKINTLEKKIVDTYYIYILQMIYPQDKRIDSFIERAEAPIACNPFSSILFNYIKDRINIIELNKFNSDKYSAEYIDLLSIGVFNFLRFEDNKDKTKYQPAKKWIETTALYKRDSVYIKKEITSLNKQEFKKKLEKISLFNINNKFVGIKQIIKENPSSYYLIDFWATWCGPCLQGVKVMKEIKLPDNVKVISISTDKEIDKQKWIKMTNKLKQSVTYRLDETNISAKEFTDFIEMQTIPRYILIDKDLNLIDPAFYHPQEPQFLPKLNDVKNYKFW